MTNLMSLRRLVRSRIGVPLQDDFMSDPIIDDAVNLAVATIETEYHWPWSDVLEQVVAPAGQPGIPVPDGYRATRAIFDNDLELGSVSPGDLVVFTGSGAPRIWCQIDDVVQLRPVPDMDYPLLHYWYRQPVWLTADEDRCVIPDQFSGAIIAKAAELLSDRESSGGDAARHGTDYAGWIARMRRDTRRATGPTRTRVRPGGWVV